MKLCVGIRRKKEKEIIRAEQRVEETIRLANLNSSEQKAKQDGGGRKIYSRQEEEGKAARAIK